MKKKKMNSFVKILLWMLLGACIGGVTSFFVIRGDDGISASLEMAKKSISSNIGIIMAVTFAIAAIVMIVCYQKAEKIVKRLNSDEIDQLDDKEIEKLDEEYDMCSNVGATLSSVMIFVFLVLLAFVDATESFRQSLVAIGLFLLGAVFCSFYSVMIIRQLKRKDPTKKGDAADLHFQKELLESCDEAERRVIYQASYKTYLLVQQVIMIVFLIAFFGQLFFGTGMMAVVLLGFCQIFMSVAYVVYSMKVQKSALE